MGGSGLGWATLRYAMLGYATSGHISLERYKFCGRTEQFLDGRPGGTDADQPQPELLPAAFRGSHLSKATCLPQVFFKSGE